MPQEFEEKLQEELCVRPWGCFAISGQSVNALWEGDALLPFFWGKLCFFFQAGIALSYASLYRPPVHPRRGSASLILTNTGKTVLASKVITARPKESTPAGKGMETSTRKSLGTASILLSTPKMQAGGPAGPT